MIPLIQLPDQFTTKQGIIQACGLENPYYGSSQFMVGTCAGSLQQFFGKIESAPLNINRDGLSSLDSTTINAMEEVLHQRIDRKVAVNEWWLYTVKLLGLIDNNVLQSPLLRPRTSSEWRGATEPEVLKLLKLPRAKPGRIIAHMKDTSIDLYFSLKISLHHVLVSATTGQGKSNILGTIAEIMQSMGACSWILDHKPDFQHMHHPNNEGKESYYRGLSQVKYWYLGESSGTPDEKRITVQASELDISLLASAIYYLPGEELQAQMFEAFLRRYADMRPGQSYRLDDIIKEMNITASEAGKLLDMTINTSNWDSTRRKLKLPGRIPSWIDGPPSSNRMQTILLGSGVNTPGGLNLSRETVPGQINVLRIGETAGGGRGYALFLSYFLSKQSQLQKERRDANERGDANHGYIPVENIIDEAQDIFNHSSRPLREASTNVIHGELRKARSLQIGYTFSVQSPLSIPESIHNLALTKIALKLTEKEARAALPTASDSEIEDIQRLGPGEGFISFHDSHSTVRAVMRRAAFKIPQPDYGDDE